MTLSLCLATTDDGAPLTGARLFLLSCS